MTEKIVSADEEELTRAMADDYETASSRPPICDYWLNDDDWNKHRVAWRQGYRAAWERARTPSPSPAQPKPVMACSWCEKQPFDPRFHAAHSDARTFISADDDEQAWLHAWMGSQFTAAVKNVAEYFWQEALRYARTGGLPRPNAEPSVESGAQADPSVEDER